MELAGIVGKANVGKSTLFSALTMVNVAVANFPFTTTKPNRGVTYLRYPCVHQEFGVKCEPVNSLCVDGIRLIPIQVIDCPGIVKGAHAGRGLGLQFLNEIRQADALIVVVDASGSTDVNGNPVEPGSHDPVEDVELVAEELDMWILGLISREWGRICRVVESRQAKFEEELSRRLSGLGIKPEDVTLALKNSGLEEASLSKWTQEEQKTFVSELRKVSKPMIIAANKADVPTAGEGISRLKSAGYEVIPCSAEAERTLRLAAERGLVKYVPGSKEFEVLDESKLTQAQRRALERIAEFMEKNGGTGVQLVIDKAYLEVLGYVPVFPVEDPVKLTDGKGRVLPDVYLVKRGSTPLQLAYKIHSELGEGFLYAIDARSKMRLASDCVLKAGDVVSIVSAKRR